MMTVLILPITIHFKKENFFLKTAFQSTAEVRQLRIMHAWRDVTTLESELFIVLMNEIPLITVRKKNHLLPLSKWASVSEYLQRRRMLPFKCRQQLHECERSILSLMMLRIDECVFFILESHFDIMFSGACRRTIYSITDFANLENETFSQQMNLSSGGFKLKKLSNQGIKHCKWLVHSSKHTGPINHSKKSQKNQSLQEVPKKNQSLLDCSAYRA
jgi:hypothetical protein